MYNTLCIEYSQQQNGDPGEIRTPDIEGRSFMLYPAELRGHKLGATGRTRTDKADADRF